MPAVLQDADLFEGDQGLEDLITVTKDEGAS